MTHPPPGTPRTPRKGNSVKTRLSWGNGPVASQILARGFNTHLIVAFGFPWRPWRPLRLTLGRKGLFPPSDQFFNTRAPITYTKYPNTKIGDYRPLNKPCPVSGIIAGFCYPAQHAV